MNSTDSADPGVPPGTGPQHDGRRHGTGFFDTIRGLGVSRSQERWVGGVCGGLARRLGVDPLLVRAGLIVLLILGIGFVAYLIAWALLPDEHGAILAEKGIRDGDGGGIFILVVIGLAVFGLGPWFDNGGGWFGPALLVGAALVAWYLYDQRKKSAPSGTPSAPTPPAPHGPSGYGASGYGASDHAPSAHAPTAHGPTAPRFGSAEPQPAWSGGQTSSAGYEPPRGEGGPTHTHHAASGSRPRAKRAGLAGFLLVLGAAVLGFGVGQAVGGSALAALLAATGAAGLATVLLGMLGRRSALSSLLSLALAVSLVGSWGAEHVPQGGFGEATWQPQDASSQHAYSWSMGSAVLDLRGYDADGGDPITADVSFGELVIYVPQDVTTRVEATANFGNVSVDVPDSSTGRETLGGTSVSQDYVFGEGEPQLTVHATTRFGAIRIVAPTEPAATQTQGG